MVTVREFDAGTIIHPNVLLLKVVDISRVKIHTNLLSQDIPKVAIKRRARVMSHLYPYDIFEGAVINKNPAIDNVSQTTEIVIGVSNPQALLKPGMLVKIEIPTAVSPDGYPQESY